MMYKPTWKEDPRWQEAVKNIELPYEKEEHEQDDTLVWVMSESDSYISLSVHHGCLADVCEVLYWLELVVIGPDATCYGKLSNYLTCVFKKVE